MKKRELVEELDDKLKNEEITLVEYLEKKPKGYIANQELLMKELIQHAGYTLEQMGYDK